MAITIVLKIAAETLTVTWRPEEFTKERVDRVRFVETHAGQYEALVEVLSAVLVRWDRTDAAGNDLSLTAAALEQFPYDFLYALFNALGEQKTLPVALYIMGWCAMRADDPDALQFGYEPIAASDQELVKERAWARFGARYPPAAGWVLDLRATPVEESLVLAVAAAIQQRQHQES
jgi:hypothetical protein